MYQKVPKTKQNNLQASANSVIHKKSDELGLEFVDNRNDVLIQKKYQKIADKRVQLKDMSSAYSRELTPKSSIIIPSKNFIQRKITVGILKYDMEYIEKRLKGIETFVWNDDYRQSLKWFHDDNKKFNNIDDLIAALPPDFNMIESKLDTYGDAGRALFLKNSDLLNAIIKNNIKLNKSQKIALMGVLMRGSLLWKNPDLEGDNKNQFQEFFIDQKQEKNPIQNLPQATMNCWEAILYAANLAGGITAQKIREMYTVGEDGIFTFLTSGGKRKTVGIPLRGSKNNRNIAITAKLTDLSPGEILYFGGTPHFGLALSNNKVMSLNAGVENVPTSAVVANVLELEKIIPWITWDLNAVLDDSSSISVDVFNPPWI